MKKVPWLARRVGLPMAGPNVPQRLKPLYASEEGRGMAEAMPLQMILWLGVNGGSPHLRGEMWGTRHSAPVEPTLASRSWSFQMRAPASGHEHKFY